MLESLASISLPSTNEDKAVLTFDAKSWAAAYNFVARDLSAIVDSIHLLNLGIAAVYDSCHVLEAELVRIEAEAEREFRRVIVDVAVESNGKA